jgi:hypothetical protein
MDAWELAAREEIRDLVARYNASGDSGRFDETLALFTTDAVLEIVPQRRYRGHAEIRDLFTGAADVGALPNGGTPDGAQTRAAGPRGLRQALPQVVRHFTATHQIDFDGRDEANGRCYYAVLTERGLDHWGRYVDRYLRQPDRWRFATRKVTIDGSVPGGWADRVEAKLHGSGRTRERE